MLPFILGFCASALPQSTPRIEVLHSNLPGWAESEVPGLPGLQFRSTTLPFSRLRVAPNGRYVLTASITGPPYNIVIRDGAFLIGQDDPAPWQVGETLDFIDSVDITSTGTLALTCRTAGGSFSDDAHLVTLDGLGWTIEYTESDPVTSLSGVGHGLAFYNPNVLEDGSLAFTNVALIGAGFGFDNAAFLNDQLVVQIGADVPTGQLSGANVPWGGFMQRDGLRFDPNASTWISHGWLWNNGAAGPDIVAVNNEIKVQAGYVLPNSPFSQTVLASSFANMGNDGSWWAAGVNANGREFWVVRDGNVVARSGMPIASGSTQTWSYNPSARFTVAGSNEAGQSYIAGHTDVSNIPNAVLVMDDQVVLREFDLMDLNGDGLLTENVEFRGMSGFGADGGLDNLGRLTTIIRLRDLNTFKIGYAVVRITPGGPGLSLGNLVAGQVASIDVRDGMPGQVSRVAFSLAGPGPTQLNTPFGEVLLWVGAPWRETSTKAIDAQGEATWTQTVPAALSGVAIWAQGAVYGAAGLQLTNAIAATIQ